ncbi:MAG: DsbA family protein [Acidobacteriota bacterium]
MKRVVPFVIIGAVLAGGLWAVWRLSRPAPNSNASRTGPTPVPGSLPEGAKPPHIRGNPNAPVTLEEFADFQCGACGAYHHELKKIEAEFGERLRVVYREHPLYPNHQYSIVAAQAAEAAGLQSENHFWLMHDKLFENQRSWTEARDKDAAVAMFVDYAKQIGLNADRFMRDFNGEVVAQRLTQDGIRGRALGVEGTPTFFVNGREAKGESWKPEGLRAMINEALREAGR